MNFASLLLFGAALTASSGAAAQDSDPVGDAIQRDVDNIDRAARGESNETWENQQDEGENAKRREDSSESSETKSESAETKDAAGAGFATMFFGHSSHSHSESKKTSSGVSVGFGREEDLSRNGWGSPHGSTQSLVGEWHLASRDDSWSCTLVLKTSTSFGLLDADTKGLCPPPFFTGTRWKKDGHDLILTDVRGETEGVLHRVGRNRYEGWRTTDNAEIYISR